MAHELEIENDTAKMFSVKETPWHHLGTILPEAPTSEEAIVAAGLDWEVEKRQLYFDPTRHEPQKADGQFAVVRKSDDRYLGGAGKGWQPLQNKQAFSFFDPFIESGEATFETAGSLDGGRRIWILAKINRDPIEVVKGDIVEKYVLLSNYHRAGCAVRGALTPIRVVCANTEAMAFNNKKTQVFKATHSKRMNERLTDVQGQIAQAESAFKQTAEFYRQFARKNVTKVETIQFINNVFNFADVVNAGREQAFKDKMTDTIIRLFETGRGSEIKGVRGTAWGLYNAVTEFVQHEEGHAKLADNRLNSSWFGRGMDINVRAFDAAKELVAA